MRERNAWYQVMHKLASLQAISRFRMGSVLFIAFWLLLLTGCVLALRGLAHHTSISLHNTRYHEIVELQDEWELWSGLGILALSPVVSLVQRLAADRAKCPLCMTPPLVHKNCQRSRGIRIFLGSYRLPVAMSVLFRGRFTCPYCGEATRCQVRQRKLQQHIHI